MKYLFGIRKGMANNRNKNKNPQIIYSFPHIKIRTNRFELMLKPTKLEMLLIMK